MSNSIQYYLEAESPFPHSRQEGPGETGKEVLRILNLEMLAKVSHF